MALGYTLQAVLGFVLGGVNEKIQTVFPLFIVMYGIFLTLGEVGPGRWVKFYFDLYIWSHMLTTHAALL